MKQRSSDNRQASMENKKMTITVREKEHWKNRITRKIDQAVESILATENPNFMEELHRQAKKKTLESLGLAELKKEVKQLDKAKKELDKKRTTAFRRMLAVVRGVSMDDVAPSEISYSEHYEVKRAVDRRQQLMETELLAEDELGRRILRLRLEKEELLDTVWLATSPQQIKELWSTVASVLEQEPTELQRQALRIEPMENIKK